MNIDDKKTILQPIPGTGATFTYTGTAGTSSALSRGNAVWVYCTTDAYVRVDVSATATTADMPVPAYVPVVIPSSAGMRVSAVQVASGGSCYFCCVEV